MFSRDEVDGANGDGGVHVGKLQPWLDRDLGASVVKRTRIQSSLG